MVGRTTQKYYLDVRPMPTTILEHISQRYGIGELLGDQTTGDLPYVVLARHGQDSSIYVPVRMR